jgi:4-alpha-glucanotransferase
MRRHGLHEMFVLQNELRPGPGNALRTPPIRSVAGINTHDMPTFAAFWGELDITDRFKLGLIPKKKLRGEHGKRRRMKMALEKFLRQQSHLKAPTARSVLSNCLDWLGAGPADIVLVNLEDLWLEKLPQNVPGTSKERPNWRRKARYTLEEMFQSPDVRRKFAEISDLRERVNQCAL